ncbi:MAG TPA: protein kinase [Ktedonosporobacter sp.]|nr:protein kinase [Ktedonosporobacter sp.]
MPLEGLQLGHYRLVRLLGSGGMGEVYLAEDARIGQQVAIKVIRNEGIAYPESESAEEARRLFEREARAIARLDHPNILPLYAYGEEMLGEQQLTYLVMPYRKEGTLATWLRQRGRSTALAPAEVIPLLQQAADALQHAHAQHVLHQDIKPTNFLIRMRDNHPGRPDLLLADFGIAKLSSATASASQSIRGTPIYMAPEQWDGHPVEATDQYALAIMVYELLVGRPPFVGNLGQVMHQHYMMSPPVPSTLNSSLSPAIDAVLLHALAKQPSERFPSVTMFARAFEEAAQSGGELRATLAISGREAITGTMRSLTLPGGRQVNITVPAGVTDGTTLRLEGQGLPFYTGGPVEPLVLTIAISAEASPRELVQDSTQSTVPVSLPYADMTSVKEASVPLEHPEAPSHLAPTGHPSSELKSASSVFGSNVTSLPTEMATSAHQASLPAEMARSSAPGILRSEAFTPVKPVKRGTVRRFVLLGLVGLMIVALGSGIVWLAHAHPTPTGVTSTPPNGVTPTTAAGVITEFPVPTVGSNLVAITAGPDGNLWFTEFSGDKVGRISPTGRITEFPIPTANSRPNWITAGPDGNLWFTEQAGRIGRISPTGTITEFPVPAASSDPIGITAGPDGNLWFTEFSGDKVGRISPTGRITEFPIPTVGGNPIAITAGPDGNFWFTEWSSDKVGRITSSGRITEFPVPTVGSNPSLITTGPDGNLWFIEWSGDKIARINSTGTITEFLAPTVGSGPSGITAGPDGNLWFTEYYGNQIGRISPNGSITEFPVPTVGSALNWIAAGADGNLWFTEKGGNKIGRITSGK